MTSQQTISKVDAVLEVIFKHDQEMPSCTHRFSDIMDEILNSWRNSEKDSKVESLETQALLATEPTEEVVNVSG